MGTKDRSSGASLVETLIAISASAVLLGAGGPWFTNIVDDARRSMETNEFLSDLAVARVEAVRKGVRVVVCASTDRLSCSSSGPWSQGRIVFQDPNNNAQRDAGEPLMLARDAASPRWVIKGNSPVDAYVSYHPVGRSKRVNGAFQAGTVTICSLSDSATKGAQIVINSIGRARSQPVELSDCR